VPAVPARALVLALAVLLAGFGAISLHDEHRCQDASVDVFEAVAHERAVTDAIVDAYIGGCRGSHALALTANNLAAAGAVRQAVRLSDEAIRREPDNYEGWAALSAALRRRGLDGAADRALGRAKRLNPRFGRAPG
jgi:Flp pilus assembly protein TadD